MSSFYSDASLVMIPSGYKDAKVYSAKPVDGSGDLDFSRGSDIEATRVNANGYIEKAQVNLLLQSNTLSDVAWYASGVTETGGQAGYDGTNDAWKLTRGVAFNYFTQNIITSGVQTFSVYAKADTFDWLLLRFQRSATTYAGYYFDLANGVVGSVDGSGVIDASVTSVGGGWYRISITFNETLLRLLLYPVPSNGGVGSSGSGSVFVQDAQLNYGLVAQTYQETTTAAVVSGITDNMPRLNYDPANPTCPHLILEPSRTNEVAFSEYLNAGIWIQSGSSVTDNDATSPEGVTNAAKIAGDGTDTQIRLYDNYTFPSTGNYVLSVFAKAGNNDFIALAYKGVDGGITAYYDLSEGTTSDSTNGTIEAVGTDGWYRCSLKADLTGPDLTGNYNIYVAKDLTTTTFPSNGDANGQYVHAYGFQVEQGSYPTSYIPTYGSSATRTSESILTDANTFNSLSSFTWFFEISRLGFSADSAGSALSLRDSSGAEQIRCHFDAPTEQIRFRDALNGYATMRSISVNANTIYKMCLVCDGVTCKLFLDGSQSGGEYTVVSQFDVDRVYMNGNAFLCNQLLVFPTALTDAECIALTSL